MKLYVRCKTISASGKDVDFTDLTTVTNNFLHSLFSQFNVTVNGVTITQANEHYHYHYYFETLMAYDTDAAASQPSNAYWYLGTVDTQPCDPTAVILTVATNRGFITRWNKLSACE